MSKKIKVAKDARDLFLSGYQGVLSTHSVDVPGYPFGSVVPYCINLAGLPVILISDIAQHTKNILADSRVSLILSKQNAADVQTEGRVTYIGDAELLDINDQDSIDRYYTFFPQSRDYHIIHDFNFYSIQPRRIRYIGGFGDIHWVESETFIRLNPFELSEERQMLDHMNTDHADAMRHYCKSFSIDCPDSQTPEMVGIDSEGFHLRIEQNIYRIPFNEEVTSAATVRKALVDMARQPIEE